MRSSDECFNGVEHQFWDQAAWSLLNPSGDTLSVSPVFGIKMSRGIGSLPQEPEQQELGSKHQTQVSAELLSSFLCSWPVLKEESSLLWRDVSGLFINIFKCSDLCR